MKHKVCLLFTFLSLSVSGISATNGQDSIRQIQLSDLEVQIRWVNPTAIRAYLDDTKTAQYHLPQPVSPDFQIHPAPAPFRSQSKYVFRRLPDKYSFQSLHAWLPKM